jgi:hypothetical protein
MPDLEEKDLIEVVNGGEQENASVSDALKVKLTGMLKVADDLAVAVAKILDREP